MRRSIRVFLCLFLALSVPLTLGALAFGLPPQYGETYLGALPLKWDRLRGAESPRIILAGGSGVAFGTRCDLLETELPGYEVVNFGLYAGLGAAVMLDIAIREAREGDIVIFSPELNEQTLSDYFRPEAMWQALDGRPDLIAALPTRYITPMLGALPAFSGSKTRLYLDGAAPAGDGIYARDSFNAYGDIAAADRERNVMPGGWDENMPLRFDPDLVTEELTERLAAAARACEDAGAQLYFRFCPMNAAALPSSEQARMDAFFDLLRERLPCPLLGEPADCLMDAGWFYDTNFHLNDAGAVEASALLAADLKALLGVPGPVTIPHPEMPAPAAAVQTDGDNADEAFFLYEPDGEGVRISGLTADGSARELLTVPVSHSGVPVNGFDAGVFAGDDCLQELILQENIRSIPDGAFAGCSRLARLVLLHTAPESCSVGTELLLDTEALIYVPASSVSAYCTNYFWSLYADRIRGNAATAAVEDAPAPAATPTSTPEAARQGPNDVVYLANGGSLQRQDGDSVTRVMDRSHLRVNTLQGVSYFSREGYVLMGWSREPDGNDLIGLGSRTERESGLVLYARWAKAAPEGDFDWREYNGEMHLAAYHGSGSVCVIPETVDGLPVRRICTGAFQGEIFDTLVFPPSLRCVEPGAFTDCGIRELTLFDNLTDIGDNSFSGGTLETLRVNAAVSPVFSGSYYDTFSDKYDRLISLRDEEKIVLASGSSGRYGYDSALIDAAFPAYAVVNMGVYAYSNARPQLELILGLMRKGDILLSAPEFDAIPEQFCVSNQLDHHFWAMLESNYDALTGLDLRDYAGVFDSFAEYQRIRGGMEPKNYGVSPAGFDDDGNAYPFPTYNEYGDFILPRPNGDRDERQHANTADYTVDSFPEDMVVSLNDVYRQFLEQGVAVYFSYTPRNRSSLTEASTPEARSALDAYLRERLCVPVISDMEDYLLSGIYFWKIDSHTSTEGAQIRTVQILEDLKRQEAEEAFILEG